MLPLLALLGLAFLLGSWSRPAAAQSPPLHVHVAQCPESEAADQEALLAIARAELMPRALLLESHPTPGTLLIEPCDAARFTLELVGADVVRELDLRDVEPAHRPRVAALALAELVRQQPGRDAEVAPAGEVASSPPTAPSQVPTPAPAPRAAPTDRSALDPDLVPEGLSVPPAPVPRWLGVGLELRVFPEAAVTAQLGPRLSWVHSAYELSLLALFSRATVSLGRVHSGVLSFAVGLPLLRVRRRPGMLLSLAGEAGATWATGAVSGSDEAQSSAVWAPFGAAMLKGALGTALGQGAYAHLELSLGYAQGLVARSQGSPAAATHGPFVGLSISLGALR